LLGIRAALGRADLDDARFTHDTHSLVERIPIARWSGVRGYFSRNRSCIAQAG
jgi:hypothetical protein